MLEKGKLLCSRHGISVRIIVFYIVLVIAPFLLLTLVVWNSFLNYAMTTLSETTADSMAVVQHEIEFRIKDYEEQSMLLYYDNTVELLKTGGELTASEVSSIQTALTNCCFSDSAILAACVVTESQVIYSSNKYQALIEIMEPYQEEIVAAGGRCCWYTTNQLFGDSKTNKYILARSLNSSIEKNVGILYFVLDDSIVIDAFEQLSSESSVKYLVTGSGEVLYCSDEAQFGTILELDCIGIGKDLSGQTMQVSGEKALFTSSYMEKTDWYCLSIIYQSEIMKNFTGMSGMFILVSAIYILFLLAMLHMLRRYIFHPLNTLMDSMDRYAQGELEPTSLEVIGEGELKNLSTHFNNMTQRISHLVEEYKKKVDEINLQKMRTLAAQLSPHFVYNALNTIKWVAVLNHQKKIQDLVESLIYIFMNVARADDSNYSVRDELELIRNYAVLQKARFMNFELIVETDEACLDCKIRKLLVQPIVENAIVHGLARGAVRDAEIKITAWVDHDLYLTVEDKGIGFDVEVWRKKSPQSADHTNIGLQNVEQIIALEYGEPYHMEIQSAPGKGTVVRYVLPAVKIKPTSSDKGETL